MKITNKKIIEKCVIETEVDSWEVGDPKHEEHIVQYNIDGEDIYMTYDTCGSEPEYYDDAEEAEQAILQYREIED